MLGAVLVILLLGAVVWLVGGPLRAVARPAAGDDDDARADLEVAKEAKYREIRDVEMDHRTGKLSVDDYRRLDRQLRGEAVEILRGLDALEPAPGPPDSSTV